MKLGSLKPTSLSGKKLIEQHGLKGPYPDGIPVAVSRDNTRAVYIGDLVPSLRELVESWKAHAPAVQKVCDALATDKSAFPVGTFPTDENDFHSPLPRAFQWADGSAFVQHVKLVRKARGAVPPEDLLTVPLMYQGGSDGFLAPREDIPLRDTQHGMDFEGEVAVITDFVPMGVTAEKALDRILLVMLCNDVSLRGLIPEELARGFGFFQSKPASAFSPFALTPDELGPAWREGRVHLPLLTEYNGKAFGKPNAGEMHFHFGQLIAHAARTRDLAAGTIIGSGTVSNEDPTRGGSCLAEKRMLEKINDGKITTPFMNFGDTVKIEMRDTRGNNLFGSIFQKIYKKDV
jgi:fumarylacetoacetate (FAA) hydrolase